MKKRFITIVTAGVLLAAGLGSFAHAQDPVNQVHAGFATRWHYNVPSDSFENHEVLAEKSWRTDLQNWDDDSELTLVFLVGDCPPHMAYSDGYDFRDTCREAVENNIIINTILCGDSQETERV